MLTSGGIWSTGKWFWKAPAHKTWTSKPILTFLDLSYTGSMSPWKIILAGSYTWNQDVKTNFDILDLSYTGSAPLGNDSWRLLQMKPGCQNQFWHSWPKLHWICPLGKWFWKAPTHETRMSTFLELSFTGSVPMRKLYSGRFYQLLLFIIVTRFYRKPIDSN